MAGKAILVGFNSWQVAISETGPLQSTSRTKSPSIALPERVRELHALRIHARACLHPLDRDRSANRKSNIRTHHSNSVCH
jgi:hypothetical protein